MEVGEEKCEELGSAASDGKHECICGDDGRCRFKMMIIKDNSVFIAANRNG